MKRWKIIGASKTTGKDVAVEIEAATILEAQDRAADMNIMVADIEPVSVAIAQPAPPPHAPATIAYEAPRYESGHNPSGPVINIATPRRGSSLGVSSIILAILAFLICWIPVVNIISLPLAALGLLLGVAGVIIALTRRGSGIGFPIAGSAISLIALVVVIGMYAAVFGPAYQRAQQVSARVKAQNALNASPFSHSADVQAAPAAPTAEVPPPPPPEHATDSATQTPDATSADSSATIPPPKPTKTIPELQSELTSAQTVANATINQHPEMLRLKADMDKAYEQATAASPDDKVRLMDDFRAIKKALDKLRQRLLSQDPNTLAARKALDDAYKAERASPVNPAAAAPVEKDAPTPAGLPQTIGAVTVRVLGATIGTVELKERISNDTSRSKEPALMIAIEVTNTSTTKKISYETWRGSDFGLRDTATLKDSFDNSYRRVGYGAFSDPIGSVRMESLYPSKSIRDVLIFEEPLPNATHIDLKLPGTNVDESEGFHFRLPVSKIERKK